MAPPMAAYLLIDLRCAEVCKCVAWCPAEMCHADMVAFVLGNDGGWGKSSTRYKYDIV